MGDEWLIALATSGATTLVAAAATDAWHEALAGFRKLFGRGDPDRERLAQRRLGQIAVAVEQADEATRDDVRQAQAAVWRTRLADLLEEAPDQAEPLRDLIARVGALVPKSEGRALAFGAGSVATANSGGTNITNTGIIRSMTVHSEPHGPTG